MRLKQLGPGAMLLLALPLAAALGQRIERSAVTTVRPAARLDAVPALLAQAKPMSRGEKRLLVGVLAGAATGAVGGLTVWAIRNLPSFGWCKTENAVPDFMSDQGDPPCHQANRSRYIWTGVLIGGTIGGVVSRLFKDPQPIAER